MASDANCGGFVSATNSGKEKLMSFPNSTHGDGESGVVECSAKTYTWPDLYARLRAGVTGHALHIDFIRHAQSVANSRGLVAGRWDADLSVLGRLQAWRLGFALRNAPYEFVWSSSLSRTTATLRYAAWIRRISSRPICRDARLDERCLGELERQQSRFIPAYAQGDLRYAPPGGESYLELTQRVLSFLVDLRETIQGEASILVATHVGPMRIIAGILNGMTEPADVLRLSFPHARPYHFELQTLNWPRFLNEKEVISDEVPHNHNWHGTDIATTVYT